MEFCRIEVSKSTLQLLSDSGIEYKLLLVDESGVDYSANETWKAFKAESDKSYKKLKEIEFKIRHNI